MPLRRPAEPNSTKARRRIASGPADRYPVLVDSGLVAVGEFDRYVADGQNLVVAERDRGHAMNVDLVLDGRRCLVGMHRCRVTSVDDVVSVQADIDEIGAAPALNELVAVVEIDRIVAAAENRVLPIATKERVVAAAGEEQVVAAGDLQKIVTLAAFQRVRRRGCRIRVMAVSVARIAAGRISKPSDERRASRSRFQETRAAADQGVIPGSADQRVRAASSDQLIVAVRDVEGFRARASHESIASGAVVDDLVRSIARRDQLCAVIVDRDLVVGAGVKKNLSGVRNGV